MFLLEYDDERSGGFEPLRHLPKGHKTVTLGLISTKTGKVRCPMFPVATKERWKADSDTLQLEDKKEVIARLREAAKFAPLEQLSVGPQCGFASTVHGNELSQEVRSSRFARLLSFSRPPS